VPFVNVAVVSFFFSLVCSFKGYIIFQRYIIKEQLDYSKTRMGPGGVALTLLELVLTVLVPNATLVEVPANCSILHNCSRLAEMGGCLEKKHQNNEVKTLKDNDKHEIKSSAELSGNNTDRIKSSGGSSDFFSNFQSLDDVQSTPFTTDVWVIDESDNAKFSIQEEEIKITIPAVSFEDDATLKTKEEKKEEKNWMEELAQYGFGFTLFLSFVVPAIAVLSTCDVRSNS
jgi:hypothetical protein